MCSFRLLRMTGRPLVLPCLDPPLNLSPLVGYFSRFRSEVLPLIDHHNSVENHAGHARRILKQIFKSGLVADGLPIKQCDVCTQGRSPAAVGVIQLLLH